MFSLLKTNKHTAKEALKSSVPVIFGYLPTGMIFGLMLVSKGYPFWLAPLMSTVIYAGAAQYLAVGLLASGSSYMDIALLVFLINSKHLFYGLSLLEPYKAYRWLKPYMIFSLTDETYAILTAPREGATVDQKSYMFLVSIINQSAWVLGTLVGAIFGNLVAFDTAGMEFAMTALFLVIVLEQWKAFRTKAPFFIGTGCGLLVLFIYKEQILLFGAIFSLILLILMKERITADVSE